MGFAWKTHESQLLQQYYKRKNIITWIYSWVHNVGFTEITHQRKRMIERLIATHLLITKEGGLGRHVSMKAEWPNWMCMWQKRSLIAHFLAFKCPDLEAESALLWNQCQFCLSMRQKEGVTGNLTRRADEELLKLGAWGGNPYSLRKTWKVGRSTYVQKRQQEPIRTGKQMHHVQEKSREAEAT